MNGMNEQDKPEDALDQLSILVADAIKELRAQRHPVTRNSLRKVLSGRSELARLLKEQVVAVEPVRVETDPSDPDHLKRQLQILGEQKARLLKDTTQLEEQLKQLWDFSIGSLLTLVAWLEVSGKRAPFDQAIKRFKEQLKSGESLSKLEDSFADLKERILKEELESHPGEEPSAGSRFSFKNWMSGRGREADPGDSGNNLGFLEEIKELLIAFLENLELSLPNSVPEEVAGLKERISRCRSYEDLLALREPLFQLGHHYTQSLHRDRDQYARLIQDIDRNLQEMEAHLLDSVGQARTMVAVGKEFDDRLEHGMAEIHESAETSRNLEELRQTVVSKLTFLREALVTKRKDDEQRLAKVTEKMENLQQNVAGMRHEVNSAQEQTKQLEEELHRDTLTGALSRRGYEDRLTQEFERYQRYRHQLSVLVFDLDHFKQVNDRFGHAMGDKCLKVVSKYIRQVIRKSDALARYGGDEFVLILPGIDQEEAIQVADKIRKLVEQIRFLFEGKRIPLTLSIGLAQAEETDQTGEDLFKRADQALYAAKEGGRNRVEACGALAAAPVTGEGPRNHA